MTRKRLYYPSSQITTDLYTVGKEFMTTDNVEYIGFYHKYMDGSVMSGAVYDKLESKTLNKFIDTIKQPEFIIYKQSLNNGSQSKSTRSYNTQPKFAYSTPIESNFINGTFKRYFIKRRNYTSLADIFEIDEEQFKLWSKVKAGIDETLYNAIAIDWKLTGPLYDITNNGTIVTYGVSDTNERTIRSNSVKFIGLDKYVTDFKEFTVYSPLCPTEFKQKFGLTK
jgi:hypothetical protein